MLNPETHFVQTRWDTIIVGAGPAGLFSALSLVAGGARNVLLIDAGPDVEARRRLEGGAGDASAHYEAGIGGAGLFSDGKLSYSLEVGGHLETELDDGQRSDLVDQIKRVFDHLLDAEDDTSLQDGVTPEQIAACERDARAAGLAFRYYPVSHIGTDRCADVIVSLRNRLGDHGVAVRADSQLVDLQIDPSSGQKVASVRCDGKTYALRANSVILAMGKIGALQQSRLCDSLGLQRGSQPIYLGVRLETTADAMLPLFATSRDPKYSMALDGDTKIKTHCASTNGEVIALNYDGLPLAGGHNYSYAVSQRSGFSILWDGLQVGDGAFAVARDIMHRAKDLAGSRLLVQSVADYRSRRMSTSRSLWDTPLTCRKSVPGDLRRVLPAEFFDHADAFLERLEALAPGFTDDAVMYAPAIEWWMPRLALDGQRMQTSLPGVYACGDGSGWSQGIVHAAATGMLAACAITGRSADVGDWIRAPSRSLAPL